MPVISTLPVLFYQTHVTLFPLHVDWPIYVEISTKNRSVFVVQPG